MESQSPNPSPSPNTQRLHIKWGYYPTFSIGGPFMFTQMMWGIYWRKHALQIGNWATPMSRIKINLIFLKKMKGKDLSCGLTMPTIKFGALPQILNYCASGKDSS